MPMDAGEIERLIRAGIPDAEVTIRDLAGDGDHYAATVIAASFRGKSRVQQHQLVYNALQGRDGRKIARAGAADRGAGRGLMAKSGHQGSGLYTAHWATYMDERDPESAQNGRGHKRGHMAIEQFIDNEVKNNDVVLFMKGTPQFPQCGFSGQVVQILDYLGVPYKGMNVLENEDLRNGIKSYSNWPTIPQLYVKGEFVGGCDIIREMFQAGELQGLMKEKGLPVKENASA